MRRIRSRVVLDMGLIVGIGWLGISSQAFVPKLSGDGEPQHWVLQNTPDFIPETSVDRQEQAIRFHLSSDAFSEANREAELNAVRAAFGQWQSVPGTILKFVEGDLVEPGVDINPGDGMNLVKWIKGSPLFNGERSNITGRLGSTTFQVFAGGELSSMDIAINGVEQTWFADPKNPDPNGHFIEGVVLHEIGHSLGLEHSPIGAATMFSREGDGLGTQAGLSTDEVTFAQSIYGSQTLQSQRGVVEGQITMNGSGVLGAGVFLDLSDGSPFAATVATEEIGRRSLGSYRFPGLPPGEYRLRVVPLDPLTQSSSLARGRDIKSSRFTNAEVNFLPTEPLPVTVAANGLEQVDVAVTPDSPAFRIERIQVPGSRPTSIRAGNVPRIVFQGDRDVRLGVFGSNLPLNDVTLSVTGDGISLAGLETGTRFTPPLRHLFRLGTIAPDATPGMRTYVVRRGDDVAYATGFLEIRSRVTDHNFDGLADEFQREHFPLFTAPEARPSADPDGDGIVNEEEAANGTSPLDANEAPVLVAPFPILGVSLDATGASVEIDSVLGVRYQLYARPSVAAGSWMPIGLPSEGTGDRLSLRDDAATQSIKFYEVRSAP